MKNMNIRSADRRAANLYQHFSFPGRRGRDFHDFHVSQTSLQFSKRFHESLSKDQKL
jgi:hypothetical protein